MQIDVVAGVYDENFKTERGFQTVRLEDKKIAFAVPATSPLASKRSISPEDLKETGAMFIRKGWNEYIDEMRESYERAGVKITDFGFFNLAAFNDAVKQNIPIIAIGGWESVHLLLKNRFGEINRHRAVRYNVFSRTVETRPAVRQSRRVYRKQIKVTVKIQNKTLPFYGCVLFCFNF